MRALTIRQPWCWLIFHGKDVENRNWPTGFRGRFAVHAAKGMTKAEWWDCVEFVRTFDPKLADSIPEAKNLVLGAIIGTVNLHTCTTGSYSPWFQGPYGFMLDTPQPCDPIPAKGALGFWEWSEPAA